MRVHVGLEVMRLGEPFAALVAAELLDARVRQQVAGQDVRVGERFAAHVARIRPLAGVRAFVLHAAAKVRETAIAVRAGVRFLAGMRAHVAAQLEIDDETLAAYAVARWTQKSNQIGATTPLSFYGQLTGT